MNPDCPTCHSSKHVDYCDRWDSCYCTNCNAWTERACDKEKDHCYFKCWERPAKPWDEASVMALEVYHAIVLLEKKEKLSKTTRKTKNEKPS